MKIQGISHWMRQVESQHWRHLFDHLRHIKFRGIYDAARNPVLRRINRIGQITNGRYEEEWNR